jgi:hypothetical protein
MRSFTLKMNIKEFQIQINLFLSSEREQSDSQLHIHTMMLTFHNKLHLQNEKKRFSQFFDYYSI